ncbi:MAG: Uma2 family endonuclease [Chloroflexi bacterium]|nr:Uma2 family endonuclease [Chloroflexota bacterium]
MTLQPRRRRFTVAEYYRMGRSGIFTEDDRVELVEGEIIEMAPIGGRHQACVDRSTLLFASRVGNAAQVRIQGPVRLSEESEVQPDVVLLRPHADFYAADHPTAADVLLVVEVGETSAAFDRRVKLPLYARSGVPEVWLVEPTRRLITAYRDPSPTGYRTIQRARPGDHLTPALLPGLQIAVADLLG